MKKIKELNFSVGANQPDYPGSKTYIYNGYAGGVLNNADSSISRHMQRVHNEEDSIDELEDEDEIMNDDILELRVNINNKYRLCETLDNLEKQMIEENIFSTIADTVGSGLKSIGLAIPGIDVIGGSFSIANLGRKIMDALGKLGKLLSTAGRTISQSQIVQGLVGSDSAFGKLLPAFKTSAGLGVSLLEEALTAVLRLFKNLLSTIIQSYDSIAASVTAAGGPAVIVGEGLANITTAITGFFTDVLPIEKWVAKSLIAGSGFFGKFVEFIKYVTGLATGAIPGVGIAVKLFGTIIDKVKNAGGPIVKAIFEIPGKILERFGMLFSASATASESLPALGDYGQVFDELGLPMPGPSGTPISINEARKRKKLSYLFETLDEEEVDEEESKDEDDLEEFSTMAGGSVQGYTGPLGREKEKNVKNYIQKEQIDWMRRLELYHKKTTNRLK